MSSPSAMVHVVLPIIFGTTFGARQHVVRFADLDEFLRGGGVAWVAVGVVAFAEGVEGLFDLVGFGVGWEAEGFVVVGNGGVIVLARGGGERAEAVGER